MSSPVSVLIANQEDLVPLAIADRCDACGAQAFVRVTHEDRGSSLLLCGHHFAKNENALESAGVWVIQDERFRINERPSQSSGVAAGDEE